MSMNTNKIETMMWRKPIPDRNHDWEAKFADYEGGDPIGFGETEYQAIADLNAQIDEVPITQQILSRDDAGKDLGARFVTNTI
jgi:hypothetical protein